MTGPVWRDGRLEETPLGRDPRDASWGAFTTAGCDRGRPLLWDRHLSRLAASLTHLGAPALGLPELPAMAELLAAAGRSGPGRLRLGAWRCHAEAWHLEAVVGEPGPVGPDASPLSLAVIHWPAAPPLVGHKSLARLPWDLAATEARTTGADDALLVDAGDRVLETSVANLWVRRGDRLLTPPAPHRCLPGVMRGWILERAGDLDLVAAEADLHLSDLEAADEVWVSNAVVGVRRVARVGDRTWTAWPAFARLKTVGLPAPGW